MKHKTEIYEMGRGEGKTYKMLKMSEELGIPILCCIKSQLNIIKEKAKKENIKIAEPILYNDNPFIDSEVLVDEIGLLFVCVCDFVKDRPRVQCTDDMIYFIEQNVGCKIYACTYTSNRLQDKSDKEIFKKIRLNILKREAKELGYKIIKEDE